MEIFLREGSPQSPMSPIRVKLEESLAKQGKLLSRVQISPRIRVIAVTAGSRHSLALTSEGQVFAWGWGLLGQLGLGDTQTVLNPTMISNFSRPIVGISAGGMHSACIDTLGECYTWGSSRYGQLGQGEEVVKALIQTRPGKVVLNALGEPLVVTSVSCGGMHTAAVGVDGTVWCWGRADNGQTGSGHWIFNFFSGIVYPHRVEGIVTDDDSARLAVCGAFHTVVVTQKGRVLTFGKEDFGMLGKSNGSSSFPTVIESLNDEVVVGASCGGWHTLLWTEKGELFVCGKGEYGRLGLGHEESRTEPTRVNIPFLSSDTRVVKASAGGSHSLVLDSSGMVWVVGRTDDGRLGFTPDKGDCKSDKKSDRLAHWRRLSWETTEGYQDIVQLGLQGHLHMVDVAAGGSHSFFLLSDSSDKGKQPLAATRLGMAGDFSAILELIADIVTFIFKWTFNLICCAIYLASFILPWRIFEECDNMTQSDWQCNAFASLFLTIFDGIAIPMGLLSLASPLRWPHIVKAFDDYSRSNMWELRLEFIYSSFCAFLDLIAVISFAICHCIPTRIHLVYSSLGERDTSSYVSRVLEKELKIIRLAFSSFIDVLFFIPGALFTLMVPSLWHCTYVGVTSAFSANPSMTNISNWDECYWEARLILISRVPYALYDLFCLPLGLLALLSPFRHTAFRISLVDNGMEWCALGIEETPIEEIPTASNEVEVSSTAIPEVAVTVIQDFEAPDILQSSQIGQEIHEDAHSGGPRPSAPAHMQNNPSRPIPITTLRNPVPKYNELYFNTALRRDCVYFGVTALVDLLLLPILLPLVVTWYRYAPIREELFGSDRNADPTRRNKPKPWGFHEYGIISRQFCFLILDLLFSPLLILIFLTQYRWLPISIARENDDLVSYRSLEVYGSLLWTLMVMVVDLFTFPFALVVILTWYRIEPIRIAFFTPRIRFGFARSLRYCACSDEDDDCCGSVAIFFLHAAVIGNFFIIVHDFLVVPIFLLIGLLSGVRTARTFQLLEAMFTSCKCSSPPPPNQSNTPSAPVASDLEQSIPQSTMPISSTVPQHYTQMSRDGNPEVRNQVIDASLPLEYPEIFPSSHWRISLYYEALNSILDFPFVILALAVICTGWRTLSLLRALSALEEEYRSYWWYRSRNSDNVDCWCCDCCCCCYGVDINWKRRGKVVEEFLLLMRDILFLLPLCIIVATLYRLPSLVLDLISRAYPINRQTPCLMARSGKVSVPETQGPILISLTCKLPHFEQLDVAFNGPAKLFVDGTELWDDVCRIFGDGVMRLGKGMLPLKLVEGVGVATGIVEKKSSGEEKLMSDADRGDQLEVWIKLDLGSTKRTTVLKNLKKMNQDTRILIQLEAKPVGNHCPVVVSVAPKVENLVRIFNLETDQLTEHSLDENFTRRNSILSTLPEAGGIVEDFWIIVALHFVEILLDFGHLALFVLTCLVPWRIPQLVCSIMESNVRSTWREATELYELHCDAQRCLTEYLIGMAPLANSLAKSVRFGTGYRYSEFVLFTEEDYSYDSYYYRHSLYGPLSYYNVKQVHSRLKRLEDVTFKRFERDSEKVIQRADKGNEEIRQFGNLLTQHREAQLMRLVMWGFRCSANMMKPEEISRLCEALQLNQNEVNFSFGGLLAEIVSVFDLSLAYREKNLRVKLDEHLRDLRAHVDQEYHTLSFRKRWNGLFTRSKNDLRKIIRLVAARALRDLGLLLLTLMIFVTMIRVLPLLRDLYEANSWSITSEPTQRIILKHIRGVAQDLKRFGICVFFVSLVFLLGVGVPSFLRKIPRRLKSLEDVTNCAKEHVDETFRFLCELLTLFAAWRTYKLVVTAGVYAILVPPACIAEAIPRRVSSVQFRFIFGIFVWFGLLFGAVYLSFNTDRNHNWSENSDVSGVRQGFLKLFGILMGVILLAACSLSRRSNYTSPIKDSTTGFVSPSWSHILSLLLGPLESLQLASVVLYFFWNGTRDYVAGEGGSFTFPVVYLFDPNTADAYGYSLAMGLAAGCVLLWVVIVSLPLVYDSDDKSAIRSIQNNPAFDALYTLFSRVIFVSIVATLMRPYSCVTGGSDSPLVLSTDPFQECGGNDSPQNRYASNVAASIYLLFFMLTSTIFHSDAPDVLSVDEREWDTPVDSLGKLENLSVKFAPLYAIVIRLGQFLICYLCFGLASKSDRREDLIAIIVLNFLMFLWAGFYPFGRGCSIPCITTLRAVGFLVVMWASIVCYCRDSLERMNSEVAWTGYVGLLIVVLGFWVAGVAAAVLVQKSASKKWQASLREGGLQSALEELISTADKVFVEDAIGGGTTEGKLSRKEQFISEIQQTLTASALGQLLVRFEEKILAERLSYDFIDNRPSWRRELLSQSLSYQTIISHARILRSSITTKAPLALLNKHVLAGILENKLPEYVAWEVYRYLYDVEPIRKLLAPLMVLTADGHRPQAVQQYYGRYTWYTDEAYTVTLLRLTKSLLFETIRSNRPQPTAPPVIATKAVRSVVESSAPPLRSSLLDVQPLVMDREWACQDCTLINPSSRNYCDACGKERPRRSW